MLVRSTPEGARDYLVPSRVHKGSFYALPQSPQLLKQILMVSGMERYFQVARCFRDEDLRADRQPEFTQLDMEMSFADREDVLELVEGLVSHCFRAVLDREIPIPFPRLTYRDAMDRYGSDKPDTRFGMEIVDITGLCGGTTFGVFNSVIESNGVVRGILLPGCGGFSRKQLDELGEFVKKFGQKGALTISCRDGQFKSPLAKHMPGDRQESVWKAFGATGEDLVVLLAGSAPEISTVLGRLRLKMGKELGLVDTSRDDFLWVVDFPMYSFNQEENRLDAEHHPFTSPLPQDVPLIRTEPLKVRANAYDLVFNGNEAASGSVRIHDRELQELILEAIGISPEEAKARYGFLLTAFEYGAPPHAGIALGYDRIIAEICREESIREVIIFPKNTNGICLLTGAPVEVEQEQLSLLGIKAEAPAAAEKEAAVPEPV
jgi:aspartyl-tRNA synthetase